MAYNDSKDWLDAPEQRDTIDTLVEIVKLKASSAIVFDSSRDALYYQQYISNIRHGVQVHYPHLSEIVLAIRTWRTNDYDNGRFTVNVGIPSPQNYNKPRTGKSQRHRRLPPPTAQGRPPIPLRGMSSSMAVLKSQGISAIEPMVGLEEETFECEDTEDKDLIALTPIIRTNADGLKAQLIRFTNCSLEPTTIATFMTGMPEWTIEDADPTTGETVVKLLLRRKDQTNG